MLLDNISLFLLIVEKGSLSAAGREMGLSPTTVSERLAALEAHFGAVLLNRTTRVISLTDEGRILVAEAKAILDGVTDLEAHIREGTHSLTGLIRVSAPSDPGRALVSDVINNFLKKHPGIKFELILTDGYLDIVGEGIDLALRFGPTEDSTLRAKGLGSIRQVLCAAPSYIETHGVPKVPTDLKKHNCLVRRYGQKLDNVWRFSRRQAQQVVTVSGDRVANDGALVRQWVVQGYGIISKLELDVKQDILAGRLLELLPEYQRAAIPYQILFPPARTQPRRVRVFSEYLVNHLATKTKLS